MDRKIRQRMLRSLVGAVLQSGLTDRELLEFVEEVDSFSFYSEFSSLLRRITDRVSNSDSRIINRDNRLIEAMNAINRRRLSKQEIEELFWKATEGRVAERLDRKQTVRSAVQKFFDRVTPSEADVFLKSLSTPSSDPFLKGISEKNK